VKFAEYETMEKPIWSDYLQSKDPDSDEGPLGDWDTSFWKLKDGTPENVVKAYEKYAKREQKKFNDALRKHEKIWRD